MSHPSRAQFIESLHKTLEADPAALAAWIGGSSARKTEDSFSDVDLQVVCLDEAVERILTKARAAVQAVSPILDRWTAPMPTWHGHAQELYRPEQGPSVYFFIDLVVMKKSHPEKFLEQVRHGKPVVLFDREGILHDTPEFGGPSARAKKRTQRLNEIKNFLPFAEILVGKEVERQRALDAMAFYQRLMLAPLVELVNMRHRPERWDFGMRYLGVETPAEAHQRVQSLAFIPDLAGLSRRAKECAQWSRELIQELSK